ncbi:MAG TPA: SLC13 family permease [Fibrobacteria bacterium]|nr:SLC13 family permease [Fibrobacteria bacterium]
MTHAHFTFFILGLMAVGFVSQRIPSYVTALSGALVLGGCGIIPMNALFAGFANPTLILFAGMFVIGDALFRTGLAGALGDWAVRRMGFNERRLLWGTMMVSAALSTLASNTATTAALIPLVLSVCARADLSASRLLMPMAFTSGYGGISALVGTPPNMIVSEALRESGHAPFGFFEFAWVGIPVAVAGMLYMDLIGRRLLPAIRVPSTPDAAVAAPVASASGKRRMWVCGSILAAVVAAMTLNRPGMPVEVVAVAGALVCVLSGCIGSKEAVESIEWETMILFGSMFAVAEAMQKSGASGMIAEALLRVSGSTPEPHAIVGGVLVLNMFLGLFLSNTACAVLLAPIGITLAKGIGADPRAILMTIAVASSCSFLTPVSTPPNILVWGPGKYRFADYVKVGGGLSAVCIAVAILVIPWKWPVFPP